MDGWNPAKADGIYSVGTLRNYVDEMPAFAAFCAEHGAARINEVTEKMAEDYLCVCATKGKSAWTVAKKASAINKAMGYAVRPENLGLKPRRKADIKRCREPAKENRRFKGCEDAIAFAKATGIRRMSVTVARPCDCVRSAEGEVIGVRVTEKGGRARVAPVLSAMRGEATRIVDKAARWAIAAWTWFFGITSTRTDAARSATPSRAAVWAGRARRKKQPCHLVSITRWADPSAAAVILTLVYISVILTAAAGQYYGGARDAVKYAVIGLSKWRAMEP